MRRLVELCLLLTAILFAGDLTVIGIARLTKADPFSLYAALMPGQSIDGVKAYPCQFQAKMVNGVQEGFCQFIPSTGPFALVAVLESNQIIARTSFNVKPNGLYFGDLVLCWNQPIYTAPQHPVDEGRFTNVYWSNQVSAHVIGAQGRLQIDYALPVTSIAIEREWRPMATAKLACISA
jgi:hypothetical protein